MGPPAPGNEGRAGPSLSRRGLLQLGAVGTIAAQGLVGAEAAVDAGPAGGVGRTHRAGRGGCAADVLHAGPPPRGPADAPRRLLRAGADDRRPGAAAGRRQAEGRPRGRGHVRAAAHRRGGGLRAVVHRERRHRPRTPGRPSVPEELGEAAGGAGRRPHRRRLAAGLPGPAQLFPLPFTLDGLLDWAAWTPAVSPSARGSLQVEPIRRNAPRPELIEPTRAADGDRAAVVAAAVAAPPDRVEARDRTGHPQRAHRAVAHPARWAGARPGAGRAGRCAQDGACGVGARPGLPVLPGRLRRLPDRRRGLLRRRARHAVPHRSVASRPLRPGGVVGVLRRSSAPASRSPTPSRSTT